jgi:hypothetical protein
LGAADRSTVEVAEQFARPMAATNEATGAKLKCASKEVNLTPFLMSADFLCAK